MKNKIKSFLFFSILILVLVFLTGCFNNKLNKKIMNQEKNISQKKVILVVAFRGFQDIEYSDTRAELEKMNIDVDVASSSLGEAVGKFGKKVNVDKLISEVNLDDYDALVFIGGPGAVEYIENNQAHQLARQAIEKNKVLGAICIAPDILAKAGVLKGKKATVWSSIVDRQPIKVLEDNGAIYLNQPVVKDGNIITANGPSAAKEFGKTIGEELNK
ncbi:DJ-1/PfpI family protein [bacterium]|nr:DJ-1/PfpI family protein [bacterium]